MQCNTTCKGDINVIELQGHTIALQDKVTQYVIMNAHVCDVDACIISQYVLISF